jgi:hypothetical protein
LKGHFDRAVREQNDDSNDDDLADLLAAMEGDDDSDSEDAEEKFPSFCSVMKGAKKFAGGTWKKYGGTIRHVSES